MTLVGTAQKLSGSCGVLVYLIYMQIAPSALPIDMNGSATEESTKILKHKPKQFSSSFIQVGRLYFLCKILNRGYFLLAEKW